MTEFVYNNAKNASTEHTLFELNYGYHPHVSFEEDFNFCSRSKSAEKLSAELRNLMIIYRQNLCHTQKFQKYAHNKDVKPWSYAPGEKV